MRDPKKPASAQVGRSLEHKAFSFHTRHKPPGVGTKGALGDYVHGLTCSCLDPPLTQNTGSPVPASLMLATCTAPESVLSPNECALCLQSLLQPSSALSPHEFSAWFRALIPSPAPAGSRQHCSRIGQPALPIILEWADLSYFSPFAP